MRNLICNDSFFKNNSNYKLTQQVVAIMICGGMIFGFSSCDSKDKKIENANLNVNSASDGFDVGINSTTKYNISNGNISNGSTEKNKIFEELVDKYFDEKTKPVMLSFLELEKSDKRIMYLSQVNFEKTNFDVLNDFCQEVVNTLDINYLYFGTSILKKMDSLKINKEKIKGISVFESSGIDNFDFSIFPNLEYLDVKNMHIDHIDKLKKLESLLISSDECDRYDIELINLPKNIKNLYLFNVDVDGAVLPSLYHINLFFDDKFPYDVRLKSFNTDYLTVHSDKENISISGQINKRLMVSDNCYVEKLVSGCTPNVYKNGKVVDVSEVSIIENQVK